MSSSVINFDAPLAEFSKRIGVKIGQATKLLALDIMTRVVERTPVKSGRARSGWDLTIGQPSDFLPPEPPEQPGAKADKDKKYTSVFNGGAVSVAPPAANRIDGTQQVFIMNNLPYIERLENGHSAQAPAGMVRISVAECESEIELILEKLKE